MEKTDVTINPALAGRFADARSYVLGRERQRAGIGTLSEKTMHAVLKRFIEPDEALHEVKIGTSYADVKNALGVFEIQTRSLNRLRPKLLTMLETQRVTVVYPIPATKRLIWINSETGELTNPRKSPKHGGYYDAFAELYKLGSLLSHSALRVLLLLIDMDEYRYLNGWSADGKKGSTRCERIPGALVGAKLLATNADYIRLLPPGLASPFTSKELARGAGIPLRNAQVMLTVLQKRGAVRCMGKQGRLNQYEPVPCKEPPSPLDC